MKTIFLADARILLLYIFTVNFERFLHYVVILRLTTESNKVKMYNPIGSKMVLFSLAVVVSLQPWKERKKKH